MVGQALGKSTALMERWSSRWSWVARVEAYTDHMYRQVDVEHQRELRDKIVSREETLEELSEMVRSNPDEVPKLRYSDKLRAIELAGKHHRLFTDQIEVKQSFDVNVSHDVRATVHSLVQATQISEYEAALRLAEELADMPEVAAQFREWALGLAPKQIGPAAMDHNEHSRRE